MKRYRVLTTQFDFRVTQLNIDVDSSWDEAVKEQHRTNYILTVGGLLGDFGTEHALPKIQNLRAIGNAPFSILAYHNRFIEEVRRAFVIGGYYPALTGACALGERILNHLLLRMRDHFKSTPEYRRIVSKESFDDWTLAIDTLKNWGVLLEQVVDCYQKLRDVRNKKAIHFNPETDAYAREYAIEAISLLQEIINQQFGAFGMQPWYIPNVPGTSFVKLEAQEDPFVKEIILPNCASVGPWHRLNPMQTENGSLWQVLDDYPYEDREITDEEFRELFINRNIGPS